MIPRYLKEKEVIREVGKEQVWKEKKDVDKRCKNDVQKQKKLKL